MRELCRPWVPLIFFNFLIFVLFSSCVGRRNDRRLVHQVLCPVVRSLQANGECMGRACGRAAKQSERGRGNGRVFCVFLCVFFGLTDPSAEKKKGRLHDSRRDMQALRHPRVSDHFALAPRRTAYLRGACLSFFFLFFFFVFVFFFFFCYTNTLVSLPGRA